MSEFCPYLSDIESVGSRMSSAMSLARADSRDFTSRASNVFTEESSLFSMTEDDLAIQATEKSCMVFRQIGRVLYGEEGGEEGLNEQVMDELVQECGQWNEHFPHIRVIGKEIPKPKECSMIEDFLKMDLTNNATANHWEEEEEVVEIIASDPPPLSTSREGKEWRESVVRTLTDHLLASLSPTIEPLLQAYNRHISAASPTTTPTTPENTNKHSHFHTKSSSSPPSCRHGNRNDDLNEILTVRSLQNKKSEVVESALSPSPPPHLPRSLSRRISHPPQHLPHLPQPRPPPVASRQSILSDQSSLPPTLNHQLPSFHRTQAPPPPPPHTDNQPPSSPSRLFPTHLTPCEHLPTTKRVSVQPTRSSDRLPLLNHPSKETLHEEYREQGLGSSGGDGRQHGKSSLPRLKHHYTLNKNNNNNDNNNNNNNINNSFINSNNNNNIIGITSTNNNNDLNSSTHINNTSSSNYKHTYVSNSSSHSNVKSKSKSRNYINYNVARVANKGDGNEGRFAKSSGASHKTTGSSGTVAVEKKVYNSNNHSNNKDNNHSKDNNSSNNKDNNHSNSKDSNNNTKPPSNNKRTSSHSSKKNKLNKKSIENDDVENSKHTQTKTLGYNRVNNNINSSSYSSNHGNSNNSSSNKSNSRASSAFHPTFKQLSAGYNSNNNYPLSNTKKNNLNKSNSYNYKSTDDKAYSTYAYKHRANQTAKANRPNSTHTIYRNRAYSRLTDHRNSRVNTFILPNIVETRSDHHLLLSGMVVESPSFHLPSPSSFNPTPSVSKQPSPFHSTQPPSKNQSSHPTQHLKQQHSTTLLHQNTQQQQAEHTHQASTQHSLTTHQHTAPQHSTQHTTHQKNRRRHSNASFNSSFLLPKDEAASIYRSEVRRPLILRSLKSRLATSPYNSPYNHPNYSEEISQLMKSKSKYQLII